MKKKKTLLLIVAALLLIAVVIGGISAYFTKTTATLTNNFTIGSVNITLTEPTWNAANATNLVPGDQVDKDPTVTNTGANPAYIFVKVTVPNYPNGATTPVNTDLFSLDTVDTDAWNLVTESTASNVHTYVYAYATGTAGNNLTALAPTASVKLFDDVTLTTDTTVAEAANNAHNTNIEVTAYAIQTEHVTEQATSQAAVWSLFNA